MQPVEILAVQETVVLRARGSELLIVPQHVRKLKSLTKPQDFAAYFREEALVNRPARKLFEAWLRKDNSVWMRLYKKIHEEITFAEAPGEEESAPKKAKAPEPKAETPAKAKKAEPAKEAKKPAAKEEAKKPAKETKKAAEAKPAKAEKATAKKPAKDAKAPAAKAKPAAKKKG